MWQHSQFQALAHLKGLQRERLADCPEPESVVPQHG